MSGDEPTAAPRRLRVAIDGPSGAGKSTVARALAKALGYTYLDTGAMYRALAATAMSLGIAVDDEEALGPLARSLRFRFEPAPSGGQRVFVDGRDVTNEIRSSAVGMAASAVSALPAVRAALTGEQRRLGERGGVVMEGRDIGTVVFPDAEAKFYLDAAPDERGRRRLRDLEARGETPSLGEVRRDIATRDHQDSTRALAPLRPADDAIRIDSTRMGVDEVVQAMGRIVRERE